MNQYGKDSGGIRELHPKKTSEKMQILKKRISPFSGAPKTIPGANLKRLRELSNVGSAKNIAKGYINSKSK